MFFRFVNYDIEFSENHKTGELLSRIDSDIATLRWAVGPSFSLILNSTFHLFGSFGFMFFLDFKLTMVILVIFPLIMGLSSVFSYFVKEYSRKYQERIAESTIIAGESFQNIKIVKSFGQEDDEICHFEDILKKAYSIAIKRALAMGIYKCSVEIITYVGK
jgi:ABC-type multidrug transport system fused ATPase/permease subunit